MSKTAIAIVMVLIGVLVAGGGAFLLIGQRREAQELRAAAIRECLTWPSNDQASCELHVDGGSLETALQVAAATHLAALRDEVVAARRRCTELDAAIGYVALGDRARLGTVTPEEQQTSLKLLDQGFQCEAAAAQAAIVFNDARQSLADKQRAAGYTVTVQGVQLPEADTPAVEATKAAGAK